MSTENEIFNRAELLLGCEGMKRIASAKVLVMGVGGVGSWCAECLIRTGVRQLTIVDADLVQASNINRQLMATTATIGQVKVDALKERLLQINPNADIHAICKEWARVSVRTRFHIAAEGMEMLQERYPEYIRIDHEEED